MLHVSSPDYVCVCDRCWRDLEPDTCGHYPEDCQQEEDDTLSDWADWARKSNLEDGFPHDAR